MAIIRNTRRHSGQFFQRRATDAFRYVGEECVLVKLADPFDHEKRLRESEAYDDVYKELSRTEFTDDIVERLVVDVYRCWAIINSPDREEKTSRTGQDAPEKLNCQVEPHVPVRTGDYLIRYEAWEGNRPVGSEKRYAITGPVNPATLRDGSYSSGRLPEMGQTFSLSRIPESDPFFRWSPGDKVVRYSQGALNDYYSEGSYGLDDYGGLR